ncbi:unnamed protein product [Gadus morhua 'NCC']
MSATVRRDKRPLAEERAEGGHADSIPPRRSLGTWGGHDSGVGKEEEKEEEEEEKEEEEEEEEEVVLEEEEEEEEEGKEGSVFIFPQPGAMRAAIPPAQRHPARGKCGPVGDAAANCGAPFRGSEVGVYVAAVTLHVSSASPSRPTGPHDLAAPGAEARAPGTGNTSLEWDVEEEEDNEEEQEEEEEEKEELEKEEQEEEQEEEWEEEEEQEEEVEEQEEEEVEEEEEQEEGEEEQEADTRLLHHSLFSWTPTLPVSPALADHVTTGGEAGGRGRSDFRRRRPMIHRRHADMLRHAPDGHGNEF